MAQVGNERAFWGSLNCNKEAPNACNSAAAEADSGPRRASVKPVPSKTTMDFESKTRPAPIILRNLIPGGACEGAAKSLDLGGEEEEEEEIGHLGFENECNKVEVSGMIAGNVIGFPNAG